LTELTIGYTFKFTVVRATAILKNYALRLGGRFSCLEKLKS